MSTIVIADHRKASVEGREKIIRLNGVKKNLDARLCVKEKKEKKEKKRKKKGREMVGGNAYGIQRGS